LLRPLNPLYAAVTAIRNAAYDQRRLAARRLPAPVVSVGNLSTGGSGKTPFVLALAQLMQSAGWSPMVLSRGYGRNSKAVLRVNPNGSAAEFGDEPLLLARAANVPVYVGADRYRAGLLAAQEIAFGPRHVFLLDDGFQHRRVERDADIVLLRANDLHDVMLPAGNLREPLASLARAAVVAVREDEMHSLADFLRERTSQRAKPLAQWTVRRSLDIGAIAPGTAVAFAGIAHPREFFADLRGKGFALASTLAFADHYEYSFRDITQILAALRAAGTRMLLTTEKDFVRLSEAARQALQAAAEFRAVPLRTEILNAESCMAQLEALLRRQQ
jgi:tetraacyldisaccharide 4'-kinase